MKQEHRASVAEALKAHHEAISSKRLLYLHFTTLVEYLFLLRSCCVAVDAVGGSALVYLAAAVSDFYVPFSLMASDKIQSRVSHLTLELTPGKGEHYLRIHACVCHAREVALTLQRRK